MKEREQELAHLQSLADQLMRQDFDAEVVASNVSPYLRVTNPATSELTERILCHPGADGSWCFWWSWRQPVGSVDDVEAVSRKITMALRSVEGGSR